jgi:hypothetical protein
MGVTRLCSGRHETTRSSRRAWAPAVGGVGALVLALSASVAYPQATQRPPAAPRPALSVAGITIAEGDTGTTPASFVITLTPRATRAVTVEYVTRDGTATAVSGDYRGTRGRIEIPAGIDTATIDVAVAGDTREEPDEAFTLVLRNPTGADLAVAVAQAEIVDDDGAAGPGAGPELSLEDGRVAEGNSGHRTVTLVASLSTPAGKPVTVDYATLDGTAVAGEDYEERSGKLRFPPGVTSRSIAITVLGDGADEGDEELVVGLANPVGAVLGRASAHALILDDDARGTVTLEALGPRERRARPGQMLVLQVRLRSDGGEPVSGATVQWTVDGQAELLDGGVTVTDKAGRTSQRVRPGVNPGLLAVRAVGSDAEQTVLFQVTVAAPPG